MIRTRTAPRIEDVPRGALVLTGHAGAAAALGVRHVSPARHAGRLLSRSGVRVAGPLSAWRTLARAASEVAPGGNRSGSRRTLAGPVRELLRAGLDHLPSDADVSPRTRTAVAVARRYRDLLADAGEVDPAEIFWAAARAVTGGGRENRQLLAVLGTGRLTADVCTFLDRAAGRGSVVVSGPEDVRGVARLERAGWVVREDARAPTRPGESLADRFLSGSRAALDGPRASALAFASEDDEVRWVLARVKGLLAAGVSPRDVVLAARDDAAVSDVVRDVAWEMDVPFRALHGVPLVRTRLGGWIEAVCEVVERDLPYEETLRLSARGLVGGLPDETLGRARERRPAGLDAWRDLDPRTEGLAWPQHDVAHGWLARLEATLTGYGLAGEATLAAQDAAVVARLRAGLEDAYATEETRRLSRADFLRDLRDLLELLTVRRDPSPGPDEEPVVELRSLHTLPGARVPHLFVLGVTEGALPAGLRDDPVLDFHDRAVLVGLGVPIPDAADLARDEEAVFAAALRAGEGEIVLSVPRRSGGRARMPSPYLARLGLIPTRAPARPPASPEERRERLLARGTGSDAADPVLEEARRAWAVERGRESAEPHDAYDGVTGRGEDPAARVLSATQVVELGVCPFRWFAHRVLDVWDPEEADETLSPRVRGNLWHAALQRAGEAGLREVRRAFSGRGDAAAALANGGHHVHASDLVREAILSALPHAFAAAEREVGVPAGAAWEKIRGGELRALERAVRGDAFLSPGAVPVGFERSFEGDWRGFRVRGVVDRIDVGPEGAEMIDYKSGTSAPRGAKDASGWGWVDVQLPMYLEAAAPELVPEHPLAAARYLSVRSGETTRSARPGANEAALAELAERVRGHLAAGSFPVDPDARGVACKTCDLAAVCRVGPRTARKRDAALAASEDRP